MKKILLAVIVWGVCKATALGQTTTRVSHQPATHQSTAAPASMRGAHRLALGLGHTHASQGIQDGKRKWLAMGAWNLNYDYWVSNRWGIGLQSDIILESFVIEHGNDEKLERNYPISLVPAALYKFNGHFTGIFGFGVESAQGHALGLTRFGVEYGIHLPQHWETGIALVWDNKWNYYNSWAISFLFSKSYTRKK